MKKKDVKALKTGLYEILWNTGGTSLASIGITANGKRWMAPTNWSSGSTSNRIFWKGVKKVSIVKLAKDVK